jgi:hypothetical protein
MNCINQDDADWWRQKIAQIGTRCFNQSISRWAVRLYDRLLVDPTGHITAPDLASLSSRIEVPRKFMTRAIATLTRSGLVHASLSGPVHLIIDFARLRRRKNSAQVTRTAPSRRVRAALLEADGYLCGNCGKSFEVSDLTIDHIIPVSLLGADHPGNWVTLCRKDNLSKRDRFRPHDLRYYRSAPVEGSVRIRFRDGFFWPIINARLRTETREDWLST